MTGVGKASPGVMVAVKLLTARGKLEGFCLKGDQLKYSQSSGGMACFESVVGLNLVASVRRW